MIIRCSSCMSRLACQWMLQMPYENTNKMLFFFFFFSWIGLISQYTMPDSVYFIMDTFWSAILTRNISFHEHCTLLLHSACSNKTIKRNWLHFFVISAQRRDSSARPDRSNSKTDDCHVALLLNNTPYMCSWVQRQFNVAYPVLSVF